MEIAQDGQWCALFNESKFAVINLRQASGRKQPITLDLQPGPIRGIAFSSQNNVLAVSFGDQVRIIDLVSEKSLNNFEVQGASNLEYTPDGKRLWIANQDGLVSLRSTDGTLALKIPATRTGAAVFAQDSREHWIVTGGAESLARRWKVSDGGASGSARVDTLTKSLKIFEKHGLLLVISEDDSLTLLKWATLERVLRILPQGAKVLDAAINADGMRIVVVDTNSVSLLDSKSGINVMTPITFPQPIIAAKLIDYGRQIIAFDDHGNLKRWELHRPLTIRNRGDATE